MITSQTRRPDIHISTQLHHCFPTGTQLPQLAQHSSHHLCAAASSRRAHRQARRRLATCWLPTTSDRQAERHPGISHISGPRTCIGAPSTTNHRSQATTTITNHKPHTTHHNSHTTPHKPRAAQMLILPHDHRPHDSRETGSNPDGGF